MTTRTRPSQPAPEPPYRPLRTRNAAAAYGVTARELAGPRWQTALHGVHVPSCADRCDPLQRIVAVNEVLVSGAALGGWASLWLRGARDIDGRVGLSGRLRPITVCVGPAGVMRRKGVILDRGRFDDGEVVLRQEVPVVGGERAICQIARRDGAEEGLAAADAACRAGLTSERRLRAFVEGLGGRPGVPRCRVVARLVDRRAASVPESHLRYVWVVEAGLPLPLVNRDVVDGSGFLVGRPDLFDRTLALAGEYDGSTHRGLEEHTHDNIREERLEKHNVTVVRATSIDIWGRRPQLVARILDGRERGMARDRGRDRWGIRVA